MAMIGLVLIQHGKGADMGASFGSGASGSLFGATGSANFLSRSTAVCATVFFAATLALSVLSNGRGSAHAAETNRLDAVSAPAPVAERADRRRFGRRAAACAGFGAVGACRAMPTR